MRLLGYVLYTLLLTCAVNGGCESQKNVLWTVNLDTPQQITIATGDMLRVMSPTFAVVPLNLGKTFQITYDHSRLSLIAERPPDSEGRMGKQYFLLAVTQGTSQVRIAIREQDKVVSSVTLDVTCR